MIRFEPLHDTEGEFRDEVLCVTEHSRAESGCLRIDVFESLCEPSIFSIRSEWLDEASFELHATLPHTLRFLEFAQKLLTHPLQGLRLPQIGGGAEEHASSEAVMQKLNPEVYEIALEFK